MIYNLQNMTNSRTNKILTFLLLFLLLPLTTLAQDVNLGLEEAQNIGLPAGDGDVGSVIDIIVNLIRIFLSFMGLLLVIIIIYAGFTWMLSMGNEEKTAQAKRTLINAIIGIVLILLSYAIVNFVISGITNALGDETAFF